VKPQNASGLAGGCLHFGTHYTFAGWGLAALGANGIESVLRRQTKPGKAKDPFL